MIYNTDIVIIGGGIAGLWTLNNLKQQGYNVILLEIDSLGCGQTIKSQGIIHGGLKYALKGNLTSAANALSFMPDYWQGCLNNSENIDLSAVQILSTCQYMWSINKLTGGISSLFASAALHSQVQSVQPEVWPQAILGSAIKSKLYKLSELVLNIPSLISALAKPYLNCCIKIDSLNIKAGENINLLPITINNQLINIQAKKYIFTAGTGNQIITPQLIQRRPLHMVLVKSPKLLPLYGHCIGLGAIPRITITTHTSQDNLPVWYLGGKLAEEGVNLDSEQQIKIAKRELATIFPKLDLNDAKWASFYVDRAEYKQSSGGKPNNVTVYDKDNIITAWPTKLALAPILSNQILNKLQEQNILPNLKSSAINLDNFPSPKISKPIWDQLL